jgi:hypothetical protein
MIRSSIDLATQENRYFVVPTRPASCALTDASAIPKIPDTMRMWRVGTVFIGELLGR